MIQSSTCADRHGYPRDVIPGIRDNLILHAGPPIAWERMSGPLRGAVIGALIFEGKAKDAAEAEALAISGEIDFAPCHHYGSVGPMAGVTSASMMVYIVENQADAKFGGGNRTFSDLNEGYGKVLRYGAFQEDVQSRARWMNGVMGPVLKAALEASGGMDIHALLAGRCTWATKGTIATKLVQSSIPRILRRMWYGLRQIAMWLPISSSFWATMH